MTNPTDQKWMREALRLAERGRGRVSPNPMVGAVLVKAGRKIAEGYHASFGGPHAEAAALASARKKARGATLYVNLEPCSSWGKTPPCAEALVEAGIKRVVVGSVDLNPVNHRRGLALLKRRGIPVMTGVLAGEADELNRGFFTLMTKRRPFVTLKMAQSLDGKIAAANGVSRWITGPEARRYVHELRAAHDAVLVGTKTALLDDPSLTVRSGEKIPSRPWRVVLDREGKLSPRARLFGEGPVTLRAVSRESGKGLSSAARGILLPCRSSGGKIDLADLLRRLGECGVTSLLVEGGGETAWSFLHAGLVDRMLVFIAPKIIGGRDAITSVEGEGISALDKAYRLKNMRFRSFGEDVLIEGEL